MKKNNLLQRILLLFSIVFLAASCNDDDSVIGMKEGEGETTFSFIRINGYTITQMDEVASIKITLEKDGIQKELKSLMMSGDKDSISSEPCFLEAGDYKVVKYRTFDQTAALLTEAFPTKDNLFSVTKGEKVHFLMPIVVNQKIDKNNILNTLHAICLDGLGADKSLWPKTWNTDHELHEWEGLEFAEYEDGTIAYVQGLTLGSNFASMKKLSPAIVNFGALTSLIIRDNALEELPENFGQLNINTLEISNTNLSSFPQSMERMQLYTLLLDGNKFTEFPEILYTQTELQALHILNEQINVIPEEFKVFKNLTSLNLINLGLSSLPDIFDVLYRISTLDVSGNKQLNSLPSTIQPEAFGNQLSYLRAVYANGCGFTTIPEEVLSPKFNMLMFADNNITSLDKAAIESMTNLQTLYLSGNKLTSFPALDMPSMRMLVLIDCGLTAAQVDRTGMPNLYSKSVDLNTGKETSLDFLFFTKEQFNQYFEGYVVENN